MKMKTIGYAVAIAATAVAFAIGSNGPGLAKAKKEAAPASPPMFCPFYYKPVCAVKGGVKMTYANASCAAADGAKVIYQGACKPHKAHKKAAKKMAKPVKKEMKK